MDAANVRGAIEMVKWIFVLIIIGWLVWRILPPKGVRSVSTDTLKSILDDPTKQFVDVRTVGEYKQHHIAQFVNIPLSQLQSELSKLDRTKETFVICQSGMRSQQAARQFVKAGFTNVINVTGGMSAWHN